MRVIGHSISDSAGALLTMDEEVADFLQRPKRELVGISYVDITHPDDRQSNLTQIGSLSIAGDPLQIRKRYVLPCGGTRWALVRVSKLDVGSDKGCLVGTISEIDFNQPQSVQENVWRAARNQMDMIVQRNIELGSDLFSDNAWTVLLGLYVAEAEGSELCLATQAAAGVSHVSLQRWLKGLRGQGLVEYPDMMVDRPQLTQLGINKLEMLLASTVVP